MIRAFILRNIPAKNIFYWNTMAGANFTNDNLIFFQKVEINLINISHVQFYGESSCGRDVSKLTNSLAIANVSRASGRLRSTNL